MGTTKHVLYMCNSPIYDMPVMDSALYQGKMINEIAAELCANNVFVSVFAPRKLKMLGQLYEMCGGDLATAKEKNYSIDPR